MRSRRCYVSVAQTKAVQAFGNISYVCMGKRCSRAPKRGTMTGREEERAVPCCRRRGKDDVSQGQVLGTTSRTARPKERSKMVERQD
jgi:hypothetical protein